MSEKIIWTIGHSTHSLPEFLGMLQSFGIELLVDIRNYPGSKRFSHFNKEALEKSLPEKHIDYLHLKALGGRRKPKPDSKNTAWRVPAFKGYADYMESDAFKAAVEELEHLAEKQKTAYMCSEAVWWSCHRALVSDYLKANGWTVIHIMSVIKSMEHPYTKAASIRDGKLSYSGGIIQLDFPENDE
jgi:uncharacterized protein (DUF488 family)